MEFTNEQLIAKAREQIAFCRQTKITGEGRTHVNQCSALFEIALAAMDAEPVGWIIGEQEIEDFNLGYETFIVRGDDVTSSEPLLPLYAAPPAPSFVPDEVLNRLEHEANTVTAWHHMDEHSCKVNRRDLLTLVNACRAAMLQSEPVSETYKLNSPVIPDGWIPVSERMPDKTGPYWCWFGKEKPSVIQQRVMMFDGRWNIFNDDSVTHWMPLPAAPKQEVKGE